MSSRLASVAACLVVLAAPATAQEFHQDARIGFKIRPPKDFTKVPLKPDEEWINARWISDKSYYQTDKTDGYTTDQKPEMYVIAFEKAKVADKVDVEHTGTAGSEKTTIVIKNPFKDYKDYLKRTYNEGGFYVAAEDKAEVEGVQVETLDIKVERGLQGGPRKIVTWIFKCDDADVAVQFELVESAWTKLKGDVLSSMRSFRKIPKDAAAPAKEGIGGAIGNAIKEEGLADLTPAQRAVHRRELEKQAEEKASKDLTDGWSAKRIGRVYVLSHVDDKVAAKFAADATAVLEYMDANLGFIGAGEYVREPILRLCKDSDECRMYRKGSSWSWGDEIVSYKDTGSFSFTDGDVTGSCAEHWLRERDDDLYLSCPVWLQSGISRAFEKCKAKGNKLEFYNDSWERVDVAEQIRAGKFSTLKDLMHLDREVLYKDYNKFAECAAAVRFFLTGPKKAKDAFRSYLDALAPIAKKIAEDRKAGVNPDATKKPKTEEEEDAQFKAKNTEMRDADKKLLGDVFARAYGTVSDADWKSLEIAYQKSLN